MIKSTNSEVIRGQHSVISILFLLVVSTIPFSANVNAVAVITLMAAGIWFKYRHQKSPNKDNIPFLLVSCVWFLVFLLGLTYTQDLKAGLRLLEAQYPIILFPFVLLLVDDLLEKDLLKRALLCFAFVILASGIFMQTALLIELLSTNQSLSNFFYWRFSGNELSERIDLHPTYLSMYVIFSIGVVFELYIMEESSIRKNVAAYCIIAYYTILTLHLSSRISFLILFMVLSIVAFHSIKRFGATAIIAILLVLIISGFFFLQKGSSIRSRLENNIGVMSFLNNSRPSDSTAHDNRTYAWYGSILIIKDNFWLGVGTGDVSHELNSTYADLNKNEFAAVDLNSHSQYFDAMIRNGMPGLIALMLIYFYGVFRTGLKRLYVIFVIIMVGSSLTENILERQKGAVFFGVFNVLCYSYSKSKNTSKGFG